MTALNLSDATIQTLIDILQRDLLSTQRDLTWERGQRERAEAEVLRLRAEVQRLSAKVAPKDFDWATVAGLDFIPAIKAYRERTGAGLKEGKEAVERAWREYRVTFPKRYIPSACLGSTREIMERGAR